MKKLLLVGITCLALGCAGQIHNTKTAIQIPETATKSQISGATTPGQVYETTATGQVLEKTDTGQVLEIISLEQRVASSISAGTEFIRTQDYDNAHWAFYEALFKIQRQPELFSNSTINDVIDKFDFSFHEQIATTIALAIGDDKALTNSIVSILEFSNYRDRLTDSIRNRLSGDDKYAIEDAYNTLTLRNYVLLANYLKSEALPPKEEKYTLCNDNFAYLKLCLSIGFKQTKSLSFVMPVVSLMKQYPKPSNGWELQYLVAVDGVCKTYDLILAKVLSVKRDEATKVLHQRYFSAFDNFVRTVRPTFGPLRESSKSLVGQVEDYMDRIWLMHAVIDLYLAPKQEPIRKDSPNSLDRG